MRLNHQLTGRFKRDELLRRRVEAQFQPGMAWSNYGHGRNNETWTLSHIVPLAAFDDLLLIDEVAQMANHWSNIRPLWCSTSFAQSGRPSVIDSYWDGQRWIHQPT